MSFNNVQAMPGAFPLHLDKDYVSESEWVIWKLLCRPLSSLPENTPEELYHACLLYTTDAADERSSVDLGGRRIIKKTTPTHYTYTPDNTHTLYLISNGDSATIRNITQTNDEQ